MFLFEQDTGLMKHKDVGKCAQADGSKLTLTTCDPGDMRQQFEINEVRTWDKR